MSCRFREAGKGGSGGRVRSWVKRLGSNAGAAIVLGSTLVFATSALCQDLGRNWSVKGFGTFGVSGTDTDQLEFRRDTSQASGVTRSAGIDIDSRLGLQLDVDLTESLHTTVQWVARQHPGDFFEQNLDWAFLRWRPSADLDLRVGRLGFDVFMLSDYRNVGYAYPWVRPPHEFYGGLPVYHFDGADIAHRFQVGEGQLTLKGFGGYAYYQVPGPFSTLFDAASALGGASAVYESGSWRARIGYVYTVNLRDPPFGPLSSALDNPTVNALWPGASGLKDDFKVKNAAVQFSSIGLAYDDGEWLGQIEGAYIDSEVNLYPSVANGYFSIGRRLGSFTPYVLLGIAETLNDTVDVPPLLLPVPQLQAFRSAVDQTLNGNGVDEKSISLGLRWDVYENVAVKAQWSHYWLGQNGAQLWVEPASGPTPDQVNVWSVGVDFMF